MCLRSVYIALNKAFGKQARWWRRAQTCETREYSSSSSLTSVSSITLKQAAKIKSHLLLPRKVSIYSVALSRAENPRCMSGYVASVVFHASKYLDESYMIRQHHDVTAR